jgi:hypothetical protein
VDPDVRKARIELDGGECQLSKLFGITEPLGKRYNDLVSLGMARFGVVVHGSAGSGRARRGFSAIVTLARLGPVGRG